MPENGTLTYADLAAFPDDNVRREIIAGELFVSPSPITRHQVLSGRLYLSIANHLAASGGAQVFYAPLDVVLSDRDVVEPDLLVVLDSQSEIVTRANIQGSPALLIEILSDARMDRLRKRDLYEQFQIREYWIIDGDADRVEVYRIRDGRYPKAHILEPGDVLESELVPGLRIDLAGLFAD